MLDPLRFPSSHLTLALAALTISCTSEEGPPKAPLPSDATTAIIGSGGGTITTSAGITLDIPPGATSGDVEISIGDVAPEQLAASVPAETLLRSTPQRFTPHGTQFNTPVTITLPYGGTANAVLRLDDEDDTTWEVVSGATFGGTSATFQTSSFSVYVIAEQAQAACGPPSAGAARGGSSTDATATGSASSTGATNVGASVDAVAIVTHRENVATVWGGHPYRTELEIRLTDYGDACALETSGIDPRGGGWLSLVLMSPSQTGFPELPAAGTYALQLDGAMAWDTPTFRTAGELWLNEADCELWSSMGSSARSGTLTLTSVSETQVEGSFTYQTATGGTVSGAFVAPICASTKPDEERCCWSPDGSTNPGSTVGPGGGEVSSGAAKITIPSGALTSEVELSITTIDASSLGASLPTDTRLAGDVYGVEPYATTFSSRVTVELPYTGSGNVVLILDDAQDPTWDTITGGTFDSGIATFQVNRCGIFAVGEYSEPAPVCDAPSTSAPTGTVSAGGTYADASAWSAVDAVATLTEYSDSDVGEEGTTTYRTYLSIRLTEYANACALEEAGYVVPDGKMFWLSLVQESESAQPGLPPAGVYAVDDASTLPLDTPVFEGAGPVVGVPSGAACAYASSARPVNATPSGTLTLTSVSASQVQGSFDFTDWQGGTHSGTFTAPICSVGAMESGCCYEE